MRQHQRYILETQRRQQRDFAHRDYKFHQVEFAARYELDYWNQTNRHNATRSYDYQYADLGKYDRPYRYLKKRRDA